MSYDEYPDEELLLMIGEESDDAKDIMYEKYKYILDIIIKKYMSMASHFGILKTDLYQEGMIGFTDAIYRYRDNKDASLARFITVCVERRVQGAILKASRLKNKMISESLSLEHTYDQFKMPLMDILSDQSKNDPLENMTREEDYKELVSKIRKKLSDSEYEVFSLLVSGLGYMEIATILDQSPKKVDNAIQRIKGKVKKIIEK